MRTHAYRAFATAAAAHLFILLSACGCGISRQQEIQLGQEAKPQFEQEFGGIHPSDELQRYVQEVGSSLVARTDRPNLPWQFRVLRSEQVNAFALPGGFIYITAGLLRQLDNEAQLAAVLSHEVGHVAHRHSVQQLQRAQIVQGGSVLASVLGGERAGTAVQLGQMVAGLALMKYSREQEREADLSGMRYMIRENYEPSAMVRVMEVLKQAGGGGPPEFFSSHPAPDSRKQYLAEAIEDEYAGRISFGRTDREQFQQVVPPALGPAPPADATAGADGIATRE